MKMGKIINWLWNLYTDGLEATFLAIPRLGWLVSIAIGVCLFFEAAPENQDDGIGFIALGAIWLLILIILKVKTWRRKRKLAAKAAALVEPDPELAESRSALFEE